MSVSTVLTTPVQIYDGSQGAVSVKNQGPATVFLDSQSSVNADNGWPIAPNSVLRWDRQEPLWACTKFGSARLNVNRVGVISDEVVTSVQRLLYSDARQTPVNSIQFDTFECAQYETLIVQAMSLTSSAFVTLAFSWYDEAQNYLTTESLIYNQTIAGSSTITIPAKGSFCQISATAVDYSSLSISFSLDTFQVYGSTRNYDVTAATTTIYSVYDGNAVVTTSRGNLSWVSSGSVARIFLPQWGHILDCYCEATLAIGNGTFYIYDALSNVMYGALAVTGGALGTGGAILVPRSRPIKVQCDFMATSASGIKASITWRDYV